MSENNYIRRWLGLAPERNEPEISRTRESDVFTNPIAAFPRSTRPTNLPPSIRMYRGDVRTGQPEAWAQPAFDPASLGGNGNSFYVASPQVMRASKQGVTAHNVQQLYSLARTIGAAQKLGLPSIPMQDLAAIVLQEGRSDLGLSKFEPKAAADISFRKMLDSQFNLTTEQKNLLGMINYADRAAKAQGVPFATAWNGFGVSRYGKTGADYAKGLVTQRQAANDPKNRQLMGLLSQAYAHGAKYGLPLTQNAVRDMDPYYKSDPSYQMHNKSGEILPVGQVIKNKFLQRFK